ncbi:uncharacterized protein BO66DRAFT_436149 [Aspergillus aculeatinus CBS 121060]|uniref:Uncharacterized protein n=1 Tax=Aspergillus aculeatinus CBS 121060 TaxID=1448322 RepID=A0ACD1HFS0_9EURO|nr:hypothetical protein BO66DRAFT_436149 [Aspergillus aculeatinus CBS 121060]RAH72482.1 hypothetical protein BO66DRAFT_436149 [Aspergillus aculeatinus CBS 121060]
MSISHRLQQPVLRSTTHIRYHDEEQMASHIANMLHVLIQTLWLLSGAQAFVLFPAASVSNYNSYCAAALSTNVTACSNLVAAFDPDETYTPALLQQHCTEDCRAALGQWTKNISDACYGVKYKDDFTGVFLHISAMPGKIWHNFNQTCSMDAGQYCNVVLGKLRATATGTPCAKCLLVKMWNNALFPYGNGPLGRSRSDLASYTSLCSYTGYSVPSTTTASSPASSSIPKPTVTCDGTRYAIQPGDNCTSISLQQSIATIWLLLDNRLTAYCRDFPTNGTLCLVNKCKVYTVRPGDTCGRIASGHNISVAQFRDWNPNIDIGCYNLKQWVGYQVCVDVPGPKYIAPTSVPWLTKSYSTAAPVPTGLANNSTRNCGRYHLAVREDSCSTLARTFGVTFEDLSILNPSINQKWLYQPGSQQELLNLPVENYPDSPAYTGRFEATSTIPWDSYPDSTYTPSWFYDLPIAPRTPTDCWTYLDGRDLHLRREGFSDCAAVAALWSLNLTQLAAWNPSLNISSPNCTFLDDFRYCLSEKLRFPLHTPEVGTSSSAYPTKSSSPSPVLSTPNSSTSTSRSPGTTTTNMPPGPSPTHPHSISRNCNQYAKAVQGDYCVQFAYNHGIKPEQLYDWNLVLGKNGTQCTYGLQAEVWYCVGVRIPSPVEASGIPGNCDLYAKALGGELCTGFAGRNHIQPSQLYAWNAVLGNNGERCGAAMMEGVYFCTGINDGTSSLSA